MGWLKPQIVHDISFSDWSRAILHSIAQPFIALDRRLRVVAVNPAMEDAFYQWTGVRLFIGLNYLEALPSESIPDRLKIYKRAFAGERISIEQEYYLWGERRHFIVTYDPLIVNGQIVGIIGSAKEISLQKQEERRARELSQKFEIAFNYTMVGMALADISGRFLQVNPALTQMLGYTADELTSLTFQEITHPEDLPGNLKEADRLKAGEVPRMQVENRYRHKDGHYIPAELSASIIRDEFENPILYVSAIQDISSRVEAMRAVESAQQNLRAKAEELARSNSDLEQFAYVASHDLQEPLRMIVSYLQFLDLEYRGKLSTQADEYLHFAVDGAKRMSIMIRDLLTYSRVGRASLLKERVDLNEIVADAVHNLKSLMIDTQAKINISKLPVVVGDRYQLLRLFQNILENSLKYRNHAPPQIDITAEEKPNEFLLSVKDNGIGFDQRDCDRIFEVFQRLHDRDQYPGSGIGLSIVQTIVQRHGGRVWAESVVNGGTTIHFSLPKTLVEVKSGGELQ